MHAQRIPYICKSCGAYLRRRNHEAIAPRTHKLGIGHFLSKENSRGPKKQHPRDKSKFKRACEGIQP